MSGLRELGECAWSAVDVDPVLVEPRYRGRIKRRDLAARALVLRSRGALQREVAAALGVSRSYASALCGSDPLGEKSERRKRSYAGTCGVCGGPTNGADGPGTAARICGRCAAERQHDDRYWTRGRILAALRLANEVATEVVGRQIRASDWICLTPSQRVKFSPTRLHETLDFWEEIRKRGIVLPVIGTVAHEFGSFSAAIAEIGLISPAGGEPSHREPRLRPKLHLVEAIADEARSADPELNEVCPSCGEFVAKLNAATGWCRRCTRGARASI